MTPLSQFGTEEFALFPALFEHNIQNTYRRETLANLCILNKPLLRNETISHCQTKKR